MTLYRGQSQGTLYDPPTMTPLINTTAMRRAAHIYMQLLPLKRASTYTLGTDMDTPTEFSKGQCVIALRFAGALLTLGASGKACWLNQLLKCLGSCVLAHNLLQAADLCIGVLLSGVKVASCVFSCASCF